MFSVISFQTSGAFTDIKLSWNWGAIQPVTEKVHHDYDSRSFRSEADASRYVMEKKLWWLKEMYKKYVQHKQILMEVSEMYLTPSKIKSMRACQIILMHLDELTLKHLCRQILLLRKELEKILPSEKNKSYYSSRYNMHEIIRFAEEEMVHI